MDIFYRLKSAAQQQNNKHSKQDEAKFPSIQPAEKGYITNQMRNLYIDQQNDEDRKIDSNSKGNIDDDADFVF
jgi:hypothetical protein